MRRCRARYPPPVIPLDITAIDSIGTVTYAVRNMTTIGRPTTPVLSRIERKLVVGSVPSHRPELGPCEIWSGSTNKRGYGVMSNKRGKSYALVHRARWIAIFGEIPANIFVCHKCDNPPCARLSHLFLGTHDQNILDMLSKGRNSEIANYRRKEQEIREAFYKTTSVTSAVASG